MEAGHVGTAEAGSSGRPLQFLAITDLAPHQRLPTSPPQNYSLIGRSTWLRSAYTSSCSMAESVTASDCYGEILASEGREFESHWSRSLRFIAIKCVGVCVCALLLSFYPLSSYLHG